MKTPIGILSIALLMGSTSFGGTLFTEDFDDNQTPDGWVAHTYTDGNHTTLGTEQDDTFRYPNNPGYLRLTEDSTYQHTTMVKTDQTLNTQNSFSFTADVRIQGTGSGADGLSFFWMSKASVDSLINTDDNGVTSVADISGGAGEWQGAPHGNDPTKSVGYYEGIRGYSFEFDHYPNGSDELQEYNHFIRLDDWDHSATVAAADRTTDNDFYYGNGWIRTHFDFDATLNGGTFSYYLERLEGTEEEIGTVTETTTFTTAQLGDGWYDGFDEAYFGIGAATGGATAEHLVDNITVVPEPSSAALIGIGALIAAFIRKHFCD